MEAEQSPLGYVLVLDEIQKIPQWSETVKGLGVGLELSDSRGLVKSQDTFDVGRCQTVRSREEGVPRIGV